MYTEEEKRLIALSIEWEGSIFIEAHFDRRLRKQRWQFHPHVNLANTRFALMKYWLELVKIGKVNIQKRVENPNHTPCYYWDIYRYNDIVQFLSEIESYLITKKEAANLVVQFCKSRLKCYYKGNQERQYTVAEMAIVQRISDITRRKGRIPLQILSLVEGKRVSLAKEVNIK